MTDDLVFDDVLFVLKDSTRMGTDVDEPEGSRFIVLSETLVQQMVKALESHDGAEELRSAAVKMAEIHRYYIALPTDSIHDAHIKQQAYLRYNRRVHELASAVMAHFNLL
jgi:hypothetical protein